MVDPLSGFYAVIPCEVLRDDVLPPNAKLLYADISALTRSTGYCYAENDYLMGLYGWSERTIQRLIKSLEERGYIRTVQEPGKGRQIYLTITVRDTPDKIVGGGRQKRRGTPDKIVAGNNVDKYIDNIPPTPQGVKRVPSAPRWKPERFEDFWDYYRTHVRGENRAQAVKEWDKLKPDEELINTMARALARQVKSEEWQRGVGIPYACRWLKNRRWEDEIKLPPARQEAAPVVEKRRLKEW